MNRALAYSVLVHELEKRRGLAVEKLAALVGAPPEFKTLSLENAPIEIEVSIVWNDDRHESVRVVAIANGLSSWQLERMEESLVVSLV